MSKALDIQRLRFDLTTIRLLLATADLGSVTQAASAQALAITAASRRISDLEEQFGLPIFERRPHGMVPTDAGHALLGHARHLLQIVEHMHDDAQAYAAGGRGLVRLAVCTSAALQFVPADLQRHQAAYPNIDIEIEEATSGDVVKSLVQGRSELGIVERASVEVPQGHVAHFYRSDRLELVTHREHALAGSARVGLQDILGYEFINLGEGSAVSALLSRLALRAGQRLRSGVRARSFDTMLAMVRAGLGVGVVPQSIAQWLAADACFVRIPIAEDWAGREFLLCHRQPPDVSSTTLTVAGFLTGPA